MLIFPVQGLQILQSIKSLFGNLCSRSCFTG